MSSILDALKKLEEERKKQLRLLEKDEIEESEETEALSSDKVGVTESDSIDSTFNETEEDFPTTAHPKPKNYLSIKQVFVIVAIVGVILTFTSLSLSYIVVQTQLSKVGTNQNANKETIVNKEEAQPESSTPSSTLDASLSASSSSIIEEKSEQHPTSLETSSSKSTLSPPEQNKSPKESRQEIKSSVRKSNNISIVENTARDNQNNQINPESKVDQVSNKIQNEENIPKEERMYEPPMSIPPSQESSPDLKTPTIENVQSPTPEESPTDTITNESIKTEKELEEKLITAKNFSQDNVSPAPAPQIKTKDLPPPSFTSQQSEAFPPQKSPPPIQESIDISKLPVLRTSDRIRLGLENMQLNVLREPSAKNPHGLAIINLTKVYVGEMIPGTPVRLLDVRTHGIAIEVVGTGERYYVPR